VNSSGQRLQVFPPITVGTTTTFNTGALSDLQLTTAEAPPRATSSVLVSLNLDATATTPPIAFDPNQPDTFNHSTSMTLYDSLGTQHTGTLYFVSQYDGVDPTTANTWNTYLYVDGTNVGASAGAATTAPDSILLEFNSDGTLANAGGASPASGLFNFDAFSASVGGANPISMQFDFSQSTHFGGRFSVNNLNQDGFATGRLIGVEVSSDGVVFARFSNGQSQELGQVALAKFTNPQGLSALGNSNWAESFDSGDVILGAPITSNLGSVQSGALEASNVDIAEQLVNLIVAQRNFQANAQSISTEDEITQTVINIR
ncbi:MAG: flagellar hook protein FlgE, partial [Pseudomonadota bacterium]